MMRSLGILLSLLSLLALSGCETVKTEERQRAVDRIVAEAQERRDADAVEAQAEHDAEEIQRAKWLDWYNSESTQAYVKNLCVMPAGPERDQQRAIAAKDFGLTVLACRPEWTAPVAATEATE